MQLPTRPGLWPSVPEPTRPFSDIKYQNGVNPLDDKYGRYTQRLNGIVDDALVWNRAALDCKLTGRDFVIPTNMSPEDRWELRSTVDFTVLRLADGSPRGFAIRGGGGNGISPNTALVRVLHNGYAFDCTGACDMSWSDVTIVGGDDATNPSAGSIPQIGWFLARDTGGPGLAPTAGRHRFYNCRADGFFSVAIYYNYASEENDHYSMYLQNHSATGKCVVITGNNIFNKKSIILGSAGTATGLQSCIVHNWFGGSMIQFSGSATSDCVYIEGSNDVMFNGTWGLCGDGAASPGRSMFYFDLSISDCNHIRLLDITAEEAGASSQQYGVYAGNNGGAARNFVDLQCSGRITAATRVMFAEDGVTAYQWNVRSLGDSRGSGISVQQTIYSIYDIPLQIFVVRSLISNSHVRGNSAFWTITAYDPGTILLDSKSNGHTPFIHTSPNDFVPVLNVGAGTIAAYSGRVSGWCRLGDYIHFTMWFGVGTVGAAVGALTIDAPVVATSQANLNQLINVRATGVNIGVAGKTLQATIAPGTNKITLQIDTNGSPSTTANATETLLAAGATFSVSGFYKVQP